MANKRRAKRTRKKHDSIPYPLVEVRWYDAHSTTHWYSPQYLEKWINDFDFPFVASAGYLVKETKHWYVLALRVSIDAVGNLQAIPKKWATIKYLK